jgi:plastocyanin
MKYALMLSALAAVVLAGCATSTAPATGGAGSNVVLITISPLVIQSVDTTACPNNTDGHIVGVRSAGVHALCVGASTDTTICSPFTPDPVSAQVGQTVQWFNNSGADVTLFQGSTPITTIPAGQTSGGLSWSQAGVINYTDSQCAVIGSNYGYQSVPVEQIIITVGTS